jgi:hypothetical protein
LAEFSARKDQHPLLRRWENDGETLAHRVKPAGDQEDEWIDLENGIQIAFSDSGACRPGDYWLIPARTQVEDGILWPREDGQYLAQTPHSLPHFYTPLALLQFGQLKTQSWSVDPVPAVFQKEPTAFQTLPQITANLSTETAKLSAINEEIQDVSKRLGQAQNGETLDVSTRLGKAEATLGKLEWQAEEFSSGLAQLQEVEGNLETKTDDFSLGIRQLQEKVSGLEAKLSDFINRSPATVWLLPLVIGISLFFAFLLIAQGNQNHKAYASQQATAEFLQTAVAQNSDAIQQSRKTAEAKYAAASTILTAVVQQATANVIQTAVIQQATAIQQVDMTADDQQETVAAVQTAVAENGAAIQQAYQTAAAQQAIVSFIQTEVVAAHTCSTIPLDISPEVSFVNVKIRNVMVNRQKFAGSCYRGSPGETIAVQMEYHIVRESFCPDCIDQIQVGFSHTDPLSCIFNAVIDEGGDSGNPQISIRIPDKPGIYYLAVARTLEYSCKNTWLSGKPPQNQYFLEIEVP